MDALCLLRFLERGTEPCSRSTSETMKFSEHLWQHLTPEWYSQYIQYDEMKEMLAGWVKHGEQQRVVTGRTFDRERYFAEVDEEFFQVIDSRFVHWIAFTSLPLFRSSAPRNWRRLTLSSLRSLPSKSISTRMSWG